MSKRAPAFWTDERIARSKVVLNKSATLAEAAEILSAEWGRDVTVPALQTLFRDRGGNAGIHLAAGPAQKGAATKVSRRDPSAPTVRFEAVSAENGQTREPDKTFATVDDLVALARKFAKKGGLTVQLAADELDMSPRRTVELFQRAQREGRTVDFVHNEITWRPPVESRDIARIEPAGRGRDHAIGVFSDMHFGSVYNLADAFRTFVRECYDEGIRDFVCPGDILEGRYFHARWELSQQSWEEQARAFLGAFPALPDVRLFYIDGNHDYTWTDANGSESGRQLQMIARAEGRTDLHFLGSRGAVLDYGGTKIELNHPKKGAAYALSYQLQNKIRDTAPARLPDILLCGHVHQYVKLRRQNVWAFYCGTFQHGDGPYGRSLGGDTATGGLVIRWRKDDDGIVRRLSDTFHVVDHTPGTFNVSPTPHASTSRAA